ncbi:MAG: hypothetical protein ACOYLB_04080 [Phototrophicaceae bacterium]
MRYWTHLFTESTWQQFLAAGGDIIAYRRRRWAVVQEMDVDDVVLCYLIGPRRFVGVMTVIGKPYRDSSEIWFSGTATTCRVNVRVLARVDETDALPIETIQQKLSFIYRNNPERSIEDHFTNAPIEETINDAKIIIRALHHLIREKQTSQLTAEPSPAIESQPVPIAEAIAESASNGNHTEQNKANLPKLIPLKIRPSEAERAKVDAYSATFNEQILRDMEQTDGQDAPLVPHQEDAPSPIPHVAPPESEITELDEDTLTGFFSQDASIADLGDMFDPLAALDDDLFEDVLSPTPAEVSPQFRQLEPLSEHDTNELVNTEWFESYSADTTIETSMSDFEEMVKLDIAMKTEEQDVAASMDYGSALLTAKVQPEKSEFWTASDRDDLLASMEAYEDQPEDDEQAIEWSTEMGNLQIEIQQFLVTLGYRMSMDVWVPMHNQAHLTDLDVPINGRLSDTLSPSVIATLKDVPVVWLQDGQIKALFDMVTPDNLYSGLLRQADLALVDTPLAGMSYLITTKEILPFIRMTLNRPIFRTSTPPLNEQTHLVLYDMLYNKIEQVNSLGLLKYLRPEFLDEISSEF